jgi:hypothetical protein
VSRAKRVEPVRKTFRVRFLEALTALCKPGEDPSEELVDKWLDPNFDDRHELTLQDWMACHTPFEWAMGIALIEAAQVLAADGVVEGEQDLYPDIGVE